MISVSAALNNARLTGTLAFLDTGPGKATIWVYGGTRPGSGATTTETVLVTLLLAKPSAILENNTLKLIPLNIEGDMISASGVATWARFFNGAGQWVMDTDAGDKDSAGEVKLLTTVLYAGGRCPLNPSIFF